MDSWNCDQADEHSGDPSSKPCRANANDSDNEACGETDREEVTRTERAARRQGSGKSQEIRSDLLGGAENDCLSRVLFETAGLNKKSKKRCANKSCPSSTSHVTTRRASCGRGVGESLFRGSDQESGMTL